MISVIIPVYNVAPYLNQCIDSVLSQTYTDYEIILVDDGSTDGSEIICDSYVNQRIRVFHTDNHGLSTARNFGIKQAHGTFIYFLDSDDWIDSDVLEKCISSIGSADVLCCCNFSTSISGVEALEALINGKISTSTWNKLFRKDCFSTIQFPDGHVMEDVATTYKILHQSQLVIFADIQGHHYRQREGSITHVHNPENLIDLWLAQKDRYDYCMTVFSRPTNVHSKAVLSDERFNQIQINLLQNCASAIARAWAWRNANHPSESPEWENMSQFAKNMFPYHIRNHFSMQIRIGLFLARFNRPWSFWLAYQLNQLTRKKRK